MVAPPSIDDIRPLSDCCSQGGHGPCYAATAVTLLDGVDPPIVSAGGWPHPTQGCAPPLTSASAAIIVNARTNTILATPHTVEDGDGDRDGPNL